MRPIELSPRLSALACVVPQGARFVDVGTDHARLPVWLLEHGRIAAAIATDLRSGPLDSARQTAGRHGLMEKLSLRMGDGLGPVKQGEVDVIAIAGMGGDTIAAILQDAPWTRQEGITLLLQPMSSIDSLRRFLSKGGYVIAREELVQEEGAIYVTMSAIGGDAPALTLAEEYVGQQRKGVAAPLRSQYLAQLTVRAERALEGLEKSTRPKDVERCSDQRLLCTQLREMEQEWDAWQR